MFHLPKEIKASLRFAAPNFGLWLVFFFFIQLGFGLYFFPIRKFLHCLENKNIGSVRSVLQENNQLVLNGACRLQASPPSAALIPATPSGPLGSWALRAFPGSFSEFTLEGAVTSVLERGRGGSAERVLWPGKGSPPFLPGEQVLRHNIL